MNTGVHRETWTLHHLYMQQEKQRKHIIPQLQKRTGAGVQHQIKNQSQLMPEKTGTCQKHLSDFHLPCSEGRSVLLFAINASLKQLEFLLLFNTCHST